MRICIWLQVAVCALFLSGISGQAQAADWIYYARQHDTLWDLCLKYTNKRGCWIELARYNGVGNDRRIPVGGEIRIPASWLVQPPVVGTVINVSGDVAYQQAGSATAVPLRQGQELHLGARLVSVEGSARLMLGGGNEVQLRANSTLELDTMSGSSAQRSTAELLLPQGAVEVKVVPNSNSRFRIQTPAAIAAVRGTEYRVNSLGVGGERMRSEVLSGSVEVAAGNAEILVPAGFGVAASKGQPPGAPRKLLAAPVFAKNYSAVILPAEIEWDSNPAATSWLLDLLAEGSNGALLASHLTRQPRFLFDNLQEGCYRVQLRAVDAEGFNGLDATVPFCVVPPIAATAQLSEIVPGATANSMRMSWGAVAGAKTYRLEVATDQSFANITQSLLTAAEQVEFYQSAEAPFSVRVIAIDANGNASPASASRDFRPPWKVPWDTIVITLWLVLIAL